MKYFFVILFFSLLWACSPGQIESIDRYPEIFPDYIGVTVPENIVDLRFEMKDGSHFKKKCSRLADTLWVEVTAWQKGDKRHVRYSPFPIIISPDLIDPFIAYRLIEPGYEGWHDMGIFLRSLSSFKEKPIVTNRINNHGCVNCHTFNPTNSREFFFHARGDGGGTVFINGGEFHVTDLKTIGPKKQGTYPSWHPNGKYVAFSSNVTHQNFTVYDTQPIEVYDTESDIILMDIQEQYVTCDSLVSCPDKLETFPEWSSDGESLFFCCADKVPDPVLNRSDMHYCIKSVKFKDGKFTNNQETIWRDDDYSASFPESNGRWLLFTRSAFGTFPIWHREADLCLIDLESGEVRVVEEINSPEAESYHRWSSNGKWLLFSSRRIDGRYTRIYISHFDESGYFSKPFLLPQKKPEYNSYRLKSYNVPEFVKEDIGTYDSSLKKLF